MKPGIPWSVKGIDTEAREAAKHAAHRSGLTLGQWLNTAIREQTDEIEPHKPVAHNTMFDILSRLDQLSGQLTRMAHQGQDTAAGRYYERSRPDREDHSLAGILARVEASERQSAENFAHFGERLETLGDKLAKGADRFPLNPEDVPGYRSLETALRNIVDHIEVSERETRDTLKAVQERLNEVADAVTAPIDSDRLLIDAPVITRLENRIADLASRVPGHEAAAQEDLRKLLHSESDKLAARIDSVKQASEAAAQRAQNQAVQLAQEDLRKLVQSESGKLAARMDSVKEASEAAAKRAVQLAQEELRKLVQSESGRLAARMDLVKQTSEAAAQRAQNQAVQLAQKDLRDFEGRMQNLFKKYQTGASGQDGGEMGRLRDEVESLGQRVDDLTVKAASEHDLESLRVVIEQLSARIAQGPDLKPLADLDRRLTEITKRLEQGHGDHLGTQIAELEKRVVDLDKRIADAMRQDQASPAWASLERQLAGVSNRLANTEKQLQHIARLEKWILQLYECMEQSLNWTRDVAEDAANRMASRLMQDWPGKAQPGAPSAELQALESALAAVKTNYENADQRNQETLGAVHETLEQIVNKLTELEQLRDQPQQAAPAETLAESAPEHLPASSDVEQASVEAYQPDDSPPSSSVAEPAQPAIQDDFIAAARRAAQAAAQQTPGPTAAGFLGRRKSPDAAGNKPASRFSLRLHKWERPVQTAGAAASMPAAPEAANADKRRRLILIGLVLLAAASGLALNTLVMKPKEKEPVTPPAVERTKPSTGRFSALDHLDAALAKSDAILGDGNFLSSLPGGSKIEAKEIAITDADALPIGIGTESLRQAALDGDARAAFIVAARFAEGKGVSRDDAAALRWYQAAAQKGLAPAQYRMGALFERGTGTTPDLEAARQWYERAAEAGNVRAMHNAAVLFASGLKTKTGYEKAAHWFIEAASHNLKDSQFNIALLYERGLGVGQDLGQALFWYCLAARQNDPDAAAKAKTLENTLPKDVAAKVKSRLAGWTPKKDSEAANVVAISNPDWQDRPVAATANYDLPVIGAAVDDHASANPVAEAQQLLNKLGFDAGEANGTIGTRTRNSIRLFELQSGMRMTGEVSPQLLARLRAKLG
jgi:localization factor PodJL